MSPLARCPGCGTLALPDTVCPTCGQQGGFERLGVQIPPVEPAYGLPRTRGPASAWPWALLVGLLALFGAIFWAMLE